MLYVEKILPTLLTRLSHLPG